MQLGGSSNEGSQLCTAGAPCALCGLIDRLSHNFLESPGGCSRSLLSTPTVVQPQGRVVYCSQGLGSPTTTKDFRSRQLVVHLAKKVLSLDIKLTEESQIELANGTIVKCLVYEERRNWA